MSYPPDSFFLETRHAEFIEAAWDLIDTTPLLRDLVADQKYETINGVAKLMIETSETLASSPDGTEVRNALLGSFGPGVGKQKAIVAHGVNIDGEVIQFTYIQEAKDNRDIEPIPSEELQ